jgi:drug/metabolite transporter (DMT)-like permease
MSDHYCASDKLNITLIFMSKKKHNSHLATIGGFAAIFLWSTTVAIARSLSEHMGPVTAAAAVYSISALAALGSFLQHSRRRQVMQLPMRYLIIGGALFVAYMLLIFLAVGWATNRQQVLEVGLLNYLWPALTLMLSLVFLGKRANWGLLPGTILALSGVFLVVTQEGSVSWLSFFRNLMSNPIAYLLAIIAAVCWATYSNLTRLWAGGMKGGAVILFLPITAVFLILLCLFLDEPGKWTRQNVLEVLFLGVSTYIAYTFWDNGMRNGNVVLLASASYFTPLFSTIISCLYLAVVPGIRLWVACGFLIAGSILSWQSISNGSAG